MSSIKFYLFSRFLGVVICQLLIAFVITWNYVTGDMLQQEIDESFNELKAISENIHNFYFRQASEIETISKHSDFSINNKKKSIELLENHLNIRKIIASVHYYSAKGDFAFLAKANNVPDYTVEKNYNKHHDKTFIRYFEKTRKEKEIIFTSPLYTRTKVFYHIGFVPVFKKNSKELEGILSFAFFPNMNPFNTSFRGLALNNNNFLVLTDKEANIISANGIKNEDVKEKLVHFIENRGVTKDNPFNYKTKEIDKLKYQIGKEDYFFISIQVPDLPFIALLGLNQKIVDKQIKQIIDIMTVIFAISAIIGVFFSVIFSRKISTGIEDLVMSVKSLRKDNFRINKKNKIHKDFTDAIEEIENLSIEIEKGRLLGNFWGQESSFKEK